MAVIGVVGLGVMGLGIAQVFAGAGNRVIVTDAVDAARAAALSRLRDVCALRVAAGRMDPAAMASLLRNVKLTPEVAGLADCDMVVEAIVESIDAKRALFAQVQAVAPGAVLATNTSSLSVQAIAQGLTDPSRMLGLHFFNPAPVMKLVELVDAGTDAGALTLARDLTEGAGKVVVTCADRPGFIVNRCARPFYGEALALLEEGRGAAEIDAAVMSAGYRLGPFALIDLIGADINLAATESLFAAMEGHPRYHVFQALRDQVARGHLGRKTGRGFVTGTDAAQATPPPDAAEIVLRIEAALVNEAASLLDEGTVTLQAIDTALRLGLNFPRGAFAAARVHGYARIAAALARCGVQAPPNLRERYDEVGGLKAALSGS